MDTLDLIEELKKEVGISFDIKGENLKNKFGIISKRNSFVQDQNGNIVQLNLHNIKCRNFPNAILKMKSLRELSIVSCELSIIPSEISVLKNLESLDLQFNKFRTIPEEISYLSKLEDLNMIGNLVEFIAPSVSNLQNLKSLNLSTNKLKEVPECITYLNNLEMLWLYNNNISTLPQNILNLKSLKSLGIGKNSFVEIPNVIFEILTLERLQLIDNNIIELSKNIGRLINLKNLYLSGNNLVELPQEIINLKNLEQILLNDNKLKKFPIEIINLKKIRRINLKNNQINTLPPEILNLNIPLANEETQSDMFFDGLNLRDNPLSVPPTEIVLQGWNSIGEYFNSIQDAQFPVNEVKVLLVGDGGAGKTSLVKRLIGERFDDNESQTHGILIKNKHFEIGSQSVNVHFWDFGGQEIMHSTHQFFLSKRSLYILVLDGRKDEKAEYWLKHIESFGGDSPILIAMNKTDENPSFELNRKFLQEKHKGIRGYFKISCKKTDGIEQLKDALVKQLLEVELVKTTWPKNWFKVKTSLENLNKNYISYQDYTEICEKEKVNEDSRGILLGFLRDLGIFLHFENLSLKDTNVINPKWITDAVYKIINSNILVQTGGILKLSILDSILHGKLYPPDKYNYIIELMKKFELCYYIDNETVLIPDLLKIEEPDFEILEAPVNFVIQYAFLPKAIMPRFIVRTHNCVKHDLLWRTGIIIEDKNSHTTAIVKVDENEKKILIKVYGNQKRDFLSHIRHVIQDINEGYEKIYPKEMVPLPDNEEYSIEYRELVGQELWGKTDIFIGTLQKEYNIEELLNGIETREKTNTIIHEMHKFDKSERSIFAEYHGENTIYHINNFKDMNMNRSLALLFQFKKLNSIYRLFLGKFT